MKSYEFEVLVMRGGLNVLPHLSVIYSSRYRQKCVIIGWLWWALRVNKKDDMVL